MHLKKGNEIEVEVQHINIAGKGIAQVEGKNIAVDGLFPGDIALVRIRKVKKSYVEAKLIKLIKPSPLRIPPKTKHAEISGGTPWEVIDYPKQLEFKQSEVKRVLENLNLNPQIHPIIGMDNPWYYRNKMQYSFGFDENMSPTLGLHVKYRKYDVYDLYDCQIHEPYAADLVAFFRNETIQKGIPPYRFKTGEGVLRDLTLRSAKQTKQSLVMLSVSDQADLNQFKEIIHIAAHHFEKISSWYLELVTVKKGQPTTQEIIHIAGEKEITEKLCNLEFKIGPTSFFQPNPVQAEKIYNLVKTYANLNPTDIVYDLFCGTGTIGLTLANQSQHIYGIDINEESIQMANQNKELNNIQNATYISGDIFKTELNWPKPDVIVIDPPRAGLSPKLIELITSLNPKKIVYVSCNLKTFARDCTEFAAHNRKLIQVQPVDQFPHTRHLELVGEII